MAHYETEQVLRITVKNTESAGVEIIPTDEGIEILLTKRTYVEKEAKETKDGKQRTVCRSNLERLVDFCKVTKERGGVDTKELRKFYHWYEPRMEEWKGNLQPEKLWERWQDTK